MEGVGVVFPVVPIFLSCFGICVHDAKVDGFPSSKEVTRELNFFGSWYSFQEWFCLRGNIDENVLRKVFCELVNALSVNERDAKSASELLMPEIEATMSGDDL